MTNDFDLMDTAIIRRSLKVAGQGGFVSHSNQKILNVPSLGTGYGSQHLENRQGCDDFVGMGQAQAKTRTKPRRTVLKRMPRPASSIRSAAASLRR